MKNRQRSLHKARMKQPDSCGSGLFPLRYSPVLAVLQFTENRSICVCQAAEIFPMHPTLDAYNPAESSDLTFWVHSRTVCYPLPMIISVTLAIPAAYDCQVEFRIKGKNLIVFRFLVSQMLPRFYSDTKLYYI